MKILLICNAGASTGVVVQKMLEQARKQGKEYEIKALPSLQAREEGKDWDVLLVGPQLRNEVGTFKELYPNKPVDSIPPMLYGRMDGAGIIKLAEEMLK